MLQRLRNEGSLRSRTTHLCNRLCRRDLRLGRCQSSRTTRLRGQAADLCVLDAAISKIDPDAIGAMKVDLTAVDDKVIHQR